MDYEKVNAEQRTQISALTQTVQALTEQVAILTTMLAKKKRSKKKSTPKIDISVPEPSVIGERPLPPDIPVRGKAAPKTGYRTGRQALPAHLETEETVLKPERCGACGETKLRIVDQVVSEKLTIVKQHTRRQVIIRKTCECAHCLKKTTAEAPPAPYARSKITSELLAWLTYQKFGLHLPLDRVRRELRDQGVHLSESFLVKCIERAAGLLEAVDGAHWRQLLAGTHMQTDGSGLAVVVPRAGTYRGIVDVFNWDKLAVFQYSNSKAGAELRSKLTPFSGTLVADAESRLNSIYTELDVVEAGCNAHGRRRFRDAESVQPKLAVEGGQFLAAIYIKEREAKALGLTGAQLLAWREKHQQPIATNFKRWLDILFPTLLPRDPLCNAVGYYLRHWDALTRFLTDPSLPLDNNKSERLLRPLALGRNNWMFAGNTEAAHRATVLMGIIATCRLQGIEPMAYMTWAFNRLGTHRKSRGHTPRSTTPAAFLEQAGQQ